MGRERGEAFFLIQGCRQAHSHEADAGMELNEGKAMQLIDGQRGVGRISHLMVSAFGVFFL